MSESSQRRDNSALRRLMQIIFQDPYGSLNPRMNVSDIIGEAPLYHGIVSRKTLTPMSAI